MHQVIEVITGFLEGPYWFMPIIYAVVMVMVFGYYTGKYGSDGPDGLIPIFGSLFWPVVLAFYIVYAPVKILYDIGKACQGK